MCHTIRVSEPVSAVQQYPRGWYPDPATPGRDRWWDGTASTRFTAKTIDPSKALFGVPFVHAMRTGANRILIATRVLMMVVLVLWFFLMFSAIGFTRGGGVLAEFIAVTVVCVAACLAAVVIGVIGLRRAPQLGAKALAIWAIGNGAAFALFTLMPLGITIAVVTLR